MSWTCSHGCHYSDEEMEIGVSFAYLDALMEAEERWYNLEKDLALEEKLARQHVLGELDCPWPWYADEPCIIQEPQIFVG